MREWDEGGEGYWVGSRYFWAILVVNMALRCEETHGITPLGWPVTVEIRMSWMIRINHLRNVANPMYSPASTLKISAFLYVSYHRGKNGISQHPKSILLHVHPLPGHSSVNMFQHATIEEAVFSVSAVTSQQWMVITWSVFCISDRGAKRLAG
jgi:hypothetical protein